MDPESLPDDPVERNRLLNTTPRRTPGRPDLGHERFPRYVAVTVIAIVASTAVLVAALITAG